MPYRVEAGGKVMLVDKDFSCKEVTFKRPVDFELKELIASPLQEHHDEGIGSSRFDTYPWGFTVVDKWGKGTMHDAVTELYAEKVFQIGISDAAATGIKLVNVQGSGSNVYTMKIQDGRPIHCTCRGFRFAKHSRGCKHMRSWGGP